MRKSILVIHKYLSQVNKYTKTEVYCPNTGKNKEREKKKEKEREAV